MAWTIEDDDGDGWVESRMACSGSGLWGGRTYVM